MTRLLQLIIMLALFASPMFAQTDAPTNERQAELQRWYSSLSPREQSKLRKRLKVMKRLPKEQQAKILKAAKEGKPALSKQQVSNLKKLSKLSYLKRARLHILMRELELAKKTNRAGYDAAIKKKGAERDAALLNIVQSQRMRWFMRSLPESQRKELMSLSPQQRSKKMRSLFEKASNSQLDELSRRHPRLKDLRSAARNGDKHAKKELLEVTADLKTLDMMVQKLSPERRKKVLAKIKDMEVEKAADYVRRSLKDQFRGMKKDRPHKDKRTPRDDNRKANKPHRSDRAGNRPGPGNRPGRGR
ncbi:MAG: hypothetical protein ACYTDT_00145 [Planctomycetota bacterium]|jgi:hypothetical protein